MITIEKITLRKPRSDGSFDASMELRGLSTDTKPTSVFDTYHIDNGSVFIEIDTGKVYLFDLESTTWCEVS